jgi:MinD superfamily P-loop ATPase
MIIAVASGKGGTGKTMVATNLALSVPAAQYIDCDVEEPNGNLFLHAQIKKRWEVGIPLPHIDEGLCTLCGECAQACEFNALAISKQRVLVFPELCHGCGVCSYVCPEREAITEIPRRLGEVEFGWVKRENVNAMPFAQARLEIGVLQTVPLIKAVKKTADPDNTVILDAPPGTSCPVVETVRGSDYCLLVTEPTPFGLNDLQLAVGLIRELGIPFGVIINRSDSGDREVVDYCGHEEIRVLMEIPFSRRLAVAYSKGISIVEQDRGYRARFQRLFHTVCGEMGP